MSVASISTLNTKSLILTLTLTLTSRAMTALMDFKTVALREAIVTMVRGELSRMIGEAFRTWKTRLREALQRQWRAEDAYWGMNVARQGLMWLIWRARAKEISELHSQLQRGIDYLVSKQLSWGLVRWHRSCRQWVERCRFQEEVLAIRCSLQKERACLCLWREKAMLRVVVRTMWECQKAAEHNTAWGEVVSCWGKWRRASLSWRLELDSRVREASSRILRKSYHAWYTMTSEMKRRSSLSHLGSSLTRDRRTSMALSQWLRERRTSAEAVSSHRVATQFHTARSLAQLSRWQRFVCNRVASKSLRSSVQAALWGRRSTVKAKAFREWRQWTSAKKLRHRSRVTLEALSLASQSQAEATAGQWSNGSGLMLLYKH